MAIAKTGFDDDYLNTDEYKKRKLEYEKSIQDMLEYYKI